MKLQYLTLTLAVLSIIGMNDVFADMSDFLPPSEYTTFNNPVFSITVPSELEYVYDDQSMGMTFDSDNMWITIVKGHFVVNDRDKYLKEIIESTREFCNFRTMEKDGYECIYELQNSYKAILNDNTVLTVYDYFNIKRSLDSDKGDDVKKCYTDSVLTKPDIWILQGCIMIKDQEATNRFIGLKEGIALNVLREAMDSFQPLDAYSTTFNELIEKMNLKVVNFIDLSKTPQDYLDRYNNESKYKEWFDKNYVGITIYDAVGFPSTETSQNILNELGYLHLEILESKKLNETTEIQQKPMIPVVELALNEKIPSWVKNIFGWYAQDQVSEDELLNAIKYLINEKILVVN